ncbi:MAG: TIGR03663 family protein [Verrucomicrobiae bacterium]|nr:TIGR03663 family protein [Verrucomicrobiae bacterium]
MAGNRGVRDTGRMTRRLWVWLLVAACAALALRASRLGLRPMHNDEAVNAAIFRQLWETGRYEYDPRQFHGPTLYYVTLPAVWLSGARTYAELSETTLRAVPVALGVGIVLLVGLMHDGLGKRAAAVAASALAVSPGMVFYSRYFIHETLLVFFTALVLGAGWRWAQSRRLAWAIVCGACCGLMACTKETFVISLAGMCVAAMCAARRLPPCDDRDTARNALHCAAAIATGAIVTIAFYSSFFTNLGGVPDAIRALGFWAWHAGTQTPHIHPWYFYFERLFWFPTTQKVAWTEAAIGVLAAVGTGAGLAGKWLGPVNPRLAQFLSIYTWTVTAVYALIPYKTPWCALSFLHGMALLAGIGVAALCEFFKGRAARLALGTVLLAAAAHLLWQCWNLNFNYFAHRRNPYAYAQTSPDILRLADTLERLRRAAPGGSNIMIKVMAPDHDYWPLPWYLRAFQQVGWWDAIPDDPFAPVMIISHKLNAAFDEKTDRAWRMVGIYELRPGVFFELYVHAELWESYVATMAQHQDHLESR